MPIFGILGHVIVNWDTKKHKKTAIFVLKTYFFAYTLKPFRVQSRNLGTIWVFMNALCKPSLGTPSHVTKILKAENGQKVDQFELIYLNNYSYWWKMVCGFWVHHQPPFFWLSLLPASWKFIFLLDLCDASCRKSLCFFQAKLRIRQLEVENTLTLKWLKVETWFLERKWGIHESFLVLIFGSIGNLIRVSEPKTKMPMEGLNNSSSKINRTR